LAVSVIRHVFAESRAHMIISGFGLTEGLGLSIRQDPLWEVRQQLKMNETDDEILR